MSAPNHEPASSREEGGHMQRMVRVHYRNWRGEERTREIRPIQVQWGTSDWHPEDQWLLLAVDPEDGKTKLFALKDCDFLHPNIVLRNNESATNSP